MAWWLLVGALAWADDRPASLGHLLMPLTPSEPQDVYVGMLERPGAGATTWQAAEPGFTCRGVDDWLEVEVRRETWPSEVPKKVTCLADSGKKVKVAVKLLSIRQEPMFVSDGTLVIPRDEKAAAIYQGPLPLPDVVVQQGKTADLFLHCDVLPGPTLKVLVDPDARDGVGLCLVKDRFGATLKVPLRVVTAR